MPLSLILNGHAREFAGLAHASTLADLVAHLELKGDRVAVEQNGTLVQRTRWAETALASGDRLEVVHFVGGGAPDEDRTRWSPGHPRLGSVRLLRCAVLFAMACRAVFAHADPVPVLYPQGSTHAFAALREESGKTIAIGEITQTVHGDTVCSKLTFRFYDGSYDNDLTLFTQHQYFRLVSDHHIQRGPSYPHPVDFLIDATTGNLTFRTPDGTEVHQHMDLPADVSNGLPPNLLLNSLSFNEMNHDH